MSSISSSEDYKISLELGGIIAPLAQKASLNEQDFNLKHSAFLDLSSKIQQLNSSPESKARLQEQFEKLLNAIEFFEKPDIIPFPWLDFKFNEIIIKENPDNCDTSRSQGSQLSIEKDQIMTQEYQKKIKTLENEIDELKLAIRKLRDENHENEKLKTRLKRIAELEKENEKLQKMLEDQGERLKESVITEKEYEAMAKEIDKEVTRIKNELEESEVQRVEIRRQYDLLNKTYQEMKSDYKNEIQALNEKIIEISNRSQDIENKLKASQFKESENHSLIELANKRISELQEELNNKETHLQLQNKCIEEYKKQLEDLEPATRYQIHLENCLKELEQKLAESEEARFEQMKLYNELQRQISSQETERINPHRIKQLEDLFMKSGEKLDELSTKIYQTLDTALTARTESEKKFRKLRKKKCPHREKLFTRLYAEKKNPCEICINVHGHEWAKSPKRKNNIIS
ncbi:unnamed protein product [Blepharisma stoltei]|uniref:Chromosome partition protein Smc n=1 Tax=Blepharisma stoltei TaxID=1481888 RepID=A0AAU9J3L4_9CILI|nr:unnamed protein product [Blepharisma stoltei]